MGFSLLAALLLSLSACNSPVTCSYSIGACAAGGACGIDADSCSDGMARKLKCTSTEQMPMRCECLENGKKTKTVELDQSAAEFSLEAASSVVNQHCGWKIR